MNEQRFALTYRESADDSGDAPGLVLGDDGMVYAVLPDGTRSIWGSGSTAGSVYSVAGKQGNVTLEESDIIGLTDSLNSLVPLSLVGANNGLATLDGTGKIPTSQLSPLAITNTYVVDSQAAMLALGAHVGDVAVRTDLNESFILAASDPTVLANWQQLLTPGSAVLSVAGKTGAVSLVEGDVANLTSDLAAKLNLSTYQAKGDVLFGTGPGAVARIGVGADGQVLVADSTQAAGVKWAAQTGGGGGGGGGGRIVTGVIRGSDGAVLEGTGFTVSKSGTGVFVVTFSPAFSQRPAVVITAVQPVGSGSVNYDISYNPAPNASEATIVVFNSGGTVDPDSISFAALDTAAAIGGNGAIVGQVNADGTIALGTGHFTVAKTGTGRYTVSFTNAMATVPVVVGNAVANAGFATGVLVIDGSVAKGGFSIDTFNTTSGALLDSAWTVQATPS